MNVDDSFRQHDIKKIESILEVGSEVIGGSTGATMGFLLGGPVGAIVGGAGGPIVAKVMREAAIEFYERVLSQREMYRVSMTINYATNKIQDKLQHGERLRQDDFFDEQEDDRATAKEVSEGVIIAAQRESQEKKVRFYGNLLANLAFEQSISREHANFLIRLGEELSYRQLCLISLFGQNTLLFDGNNRLNLSVGDYREKWQGQPVSKPDIELVALLQEIYALYQRGLVGNGGSAMFSIGDANPSQLSPIGSAVYLYNLMELGEVSDTDLNTLIYVLR